MVDVPVENHLWLLERFLEALWAQGPSRLLDVGCGAGRLLRAAAAREIAATGLDQGGPQLVGLRAEGFTVQEGFAETLPFADDAFDWVTMRHVPHHLADPARGLAEALRVARTGVLVAEPWFDPALPCQAAALEYDRFEKRQHRRVGRVHGESLVLAELIALIPEGARGAIEVEARQWLRLRAREEGEALDAARALVADLPAENPEHAALEQLATRIAADGLSWNGSVACLLRWRAPGAGA